MHGRLPARAAARARPAARRPAAAARRRHDRRRARRGGRGAGHALRGAARGRRGRWRRHDRVEQPLVTALPAAVLYGRLLASRSRTARRRLAPSAGCGSPTGASSRCRWTAGSRPRTRDEAILAGVEAPVLDLGCGPGRHLLRCAQPGKRGLGVDLSPVAVLLARGRGADAINGSLGRRSRAPGAGARSCCWTATSASAARRACCCGARASCSRPAARSSSRSIRRRADRARKVRLEAPDVVSEWFRWARVGVDGVAEAAARAGFAVDEVRELAGRTFVTLDAEARTPLHAPARPARSAGLLALAAARAVADRALGSILLVLIAIVATTGFLSHAAYMPDLRATRSSRRPGPPRAFFDWPTRPSWLYAFTQGLHMTSAYRDPLPAGEAVVGHPAAVRLPAGGQSRAGARAALDRPARLQRRLPARDGRHERAVLVPVQLQLRGRPLLRRDRVRRRAGAARDRQAAGDRCAPTVSAGSSARCATTSCTRGRSRPSTAGSSRATRRRRRSPAAACSPSPGRARAGAGGQRRAVARRAVPLGGVPRAPARAASRSTRRAAAGRRDARRGRSGLPARVARRRPGVDLARDQLALPQRSATLPIACVEGWARREWTGVRLSDLAGWPASRARGAVRRVAAAGGVLRRHRSAATSSRPRSLLALKVEGEDLSPDHGFPARIIVPALPGVHNTKWVGAITFRGVMSGRTGPGRSTCWPPGFLPLALRAGDLLDFRAARTPCVAGRRGDPARLVLWPLYSARTGRPGRAVPPRDQRRAGAAGLSLLMLLVFWGRSAARARTRTARRRAR